MKYQNIVYQFKISLQEISPPVWRRIQVPSRYSFWDLHVAIQDSMGWLDYHLHAFRIKKPHKSRVSHIGIPDDEFDDIQELPGWTEYIADYFQVPGKTAEYEYDFGDGWIHDILFEGMLLKEKNVKYPLCLAGERACPPEDCGGVWGYAELLEILNDPSHEEHESMKLWLSGLYVNYDPEHFDCRSVRFDAPGRRWNRAFQQG